MDTTRIRVYKRGFCRRSGMWCTAMKLEGLLGLQRAREAKTLSIRERLWKGCCKSPVQRGLEYGSQSQHVWSTLCMEFRTSWQYLFALWAAIYKFVFICFSLHLYSKEFNLESSLSCIRLMIQVFIDRAVNSTFNQREGTSIGYIERLMGFKGSWS